MKIRLLTITHKVPEWISLGFLDYAKRMPKHLKIELVEIPAEKQRSTKNIEVIMAKESEKMLHAIKPQDYCIALDIHGQQWSTEELAQRFLIWQGKGQTIAFLIGGPEGLGPLCLLKAHEKWSLSKLTFPHAMVRILLAEQLYRAYTLLQHHPYHK